MDELNKQRTKAALDKKSATKKTASKGKNMKSITAAYLGKYRLPELFQSCFSLKVLKEL